MYCNKNSLRIIKGIIISSLIGVNIIYSINSIGMEEVKEEFTKELNESKKYAIRKIVDNELNCIVVFDDTNELVTIKFKDKNDKKSKTKEIVFGDFLTEEIIKREFLKNIAKVNWGNIDSGDLKKIYI